MRQQIIILYDQFVKVKSFFSYGIPYITRKNIEIYLLQSSLSTGPNKSRLTFAK